MIGLAAVLSADDSAVRVSILSPALESAPATCFLSCYRLNFTSPARDIVTSRMQPGPAEAGVYRRA